jgi:circadian clock protein KaiB
VKNNYIISDDIHLSATNEWELRLYVAGETLRSKAAFTNIDRICEAHLRGHYHLEVIDLKKNPKLAIVEQIVAIPTLVRILPLPVKKVLGDLSSTKKVISGLDIKIKNAGG